MRRHIAILVLGLVELAGCSSWPPAGQGGMAEVRPPVATSGERSEAAYAALKTLAERLDALRSAGAAARYPARLVTANRLTVRIRRALAGGLVEDAESDLTLLVSQVDALSADMDQPTVLPGRPA